MCVGMIRAGAQSPSEHGMLYHWLRYQKVISVDHVHMIVEDNFVKSGVIMKSYNKQWWKGTCPLTIGQIG